MGNYLPPRQARELFNAIKPRAKPAEDGPPVKRRRLAREDAEEALGARCPEATEIPRIDRPLAGSWRAVDPVTAKTFFVPAPYVSRLTCGVGNRNVDELKALTDGANRTRVGAYLSPYAWATPRCMSRVETRKVYNMRTGEIIASGGPWRFDSLTTSAIGYLTYDGHVEANTVPFGPLAFGPDDEPALAGMVPAAPVASTSSAHGAPGTAGPSRPTTGADGQSPLANPPNESANHPLHPWFQMLPTSGRVPAWYHDQVERLRRMPIPAVVDNASIITGPSATSRAFRIRYSVVTTVTDGYLPVQNTSSTASAAPAASADVPSQAAAGQPGAPQRDPFRAVAMTAQRGVYEQDDPTFFQVDAGEQVLAYGWYHGDMFTPPAIGYFEGWPAWTQHGATMQQNGATGQRDSVSARQDGVSPQTNDAAEQQSDVAEEEDGSSEDSVEPVSGVAARIINAEGSLDRDSTAEARRYLNATRRASARDNTNSPTTPRRSHAFALPEDPSQRSSSLPPSDPPQDDTSSVVFEDDGVGLALSDADALPGSPVLGAYPASDEITGIGEDLTDPSEVGNAEAALTTGNLGTNGTAANATMLPIPEVDENEGAEAREGARGVNDHPVHDVQEVTPPPPMTPPRRTTRSLSRRPALRPAPLPLSRQRVTRRAASNPPTGDAER